MYELDEEEEEEEEDMANTGGRNSKTSANAKPPAGQGTPENPDVNGNCTVKADAYNKLVQKTKTLTKTSRELTNATNKSERLEQQITQMTASLEDANVIKDQLMQQIAEKDKMIEELKQKNGEFTQVLRKNGKVAPSELNESLKDKVSEAAKKYMFRTVKFVEDDEDLLNVTESLIKYLPKKQDDLGELSVEEFKRLYYLTTNEGLKLGRQYVANEGKKRAQGT